MKQPIRILLALYPKKWRDRYGTELEALLEDVEPGARDLADLAWGGIKMQMTNWGVAKFVGAFAVAGLIIAGVTGMLMKDTYISKAVLRMKSDPDALANAETKALSRASISSVIMASGIYREELAREPLEDVIERMRTRDIHIAIMHPVKPSDNDVFKVSFSDPDPLKAQKVTRLLIDRLAENKPFSQGHDLQVLDAPTIPNRPVAPNRLLMALLGSAIGAMIGVVIVGLRKLRRQTLIYAILFGVAGASISVIPSYFVAPGYYTSQSVVRIQRPEDLKKISGALRSEIDLRHLKAGFVERRLNPKVVFLSISATGKDPETAQGIIHDLVTIARSESTFLEVIDDSTSLSGPNRYIIAFLGVGVGILSGSATARLRAKT